MIQQELSTAQVLLVDNGSIKASATLTLRRLAAGLSEQCGCNVDAVSLRHADKIAAQELMGKPASVLLDYLRNRLQSGQRNFIVLPLFFGLSRAITSFIPEQKQLLDAEFGDFKLQIADVLYPLPQGEDLLVEILHDNISSTAQQYNIRAQNVVLVDHGSPIPRITQVREHIAAALHGLLGAGVELHQAVMERRDGPEYDFNGPLLKDQLLQMAHAGNKSAMVSMMFLLPGKHAGASGDIEQICNEVKQQYPGFDIWITPLISDSPKLLYLLAKRLNEYLK